MTETTATISKGIDGSLISRSISVIKDNIINRKEYKKNSILCIYFNKNDTFIQFFNRIIKDNSIKIGNNTYFITNYYDYVKKSKVLKCCFIKEEQTETLNLFSNKKENSIDPDILTKFAELKLLDAFDSFNMGQVILGGLLGIIIGYLLTLLVSGMI